MTQTSWPFYGVETNETQFSKWARSLAFSGISTGLAITPGTGMQVLLGAGSALVRGVFYENDASSALSIGGAPTTGNTRLDAIVLRLDQTANSITAAIKPGTATTSGGTLPALTQTETVWELLIGQVSVAAGIATITSAMITETLPSTGLRVYPYIPSKRPNPAEPIALGIDTTNKRLELWIAGGWVNLFDIAQMSGTLSIAKGGTGATTSNAALNALGVYPQPSAPAHAARRIWIPTRS